MDLNSKISLFRDYYDTDPIGELSVWEFIHYVRKSKRYESEFKKIRNSEASPEIIKKIKSTLPAVTVSGIFSKRKVSGLIRHSGFVCLDFDWKDNFDITDWPGLRDDLMNCVNIFFSSLSASGRGVFVVVPITYPDQHIRQVNSLIIDFWNVLDITADPACKDVCRLRGISYDPDAKINPNAISYKKIQRDIPPPLVRKKYYSNKDFIQLIQLIVDSGIDITANYHEWFSIGCALANELSESGREHFHSISQFHPAYTRREADTQYNNCLKSRRKGYTKNTIFFIADQYRINLKRMRKKMRS